MVISHHFYGIKNVLHNWLRVWFLEADEAVSTLENIIKVETTMNSFNFSVLTIYSCTYVPLWPECMKIRSPVSTLRHLSPVSLILFITSMNRSPWCCKRVEAFWFSGFLQICGSSCFAEHWLSAHAKAVCSWGWNGRWKLAPWNPRLRFSDGWHLNVICRGAAAASGWVQVSCVFVAEESGAEDWQVDWFTVCSKCERCWITWESNPIRSKI